ncbi:MAG: hypothetical protein AUI10_08695 [Actinobacteria bacterium 13_2_20CM_2_72_6]|jgi:AcrR family transcriptional regulator|nr:MAG: hypothetical protein AUI10_08695 [Actinobacteria bacterium 13_2_20CM_2_72_6]
MYVRPISEPPVQDPDDLTARARIRDAALRLFTERGNDGTTIRDIAKEAGVSLGLVRHHFGSKEALREACDRYAVDRMLRLKEQMMLDGEMSNPGFMSAAHPQILALYRYFARALVDGSPAAAGMFDELVELTAQWTERYHPGKLVDRRAHAAALVAAQSGLLAMHEHVSRVLGADMFSPDGHLRMTHGLIDFYSQPLLTPEQAAEGHAAIDRLQATRAAQPRTTSEGTPR